mgnify:FL=1
MNYKGSNKFGVLPRRTVIANQPHMLAYINPQEEMLLRQLGGTGQAGPMGVPAYPPGDGGFSPDGGGGYGGGGGFGGFGGSEGPSNGGGGYNDAVAAAQQQAAANAAAMAAADAAIAGQMAAAAQEEENAAAMAEAEAAAVAIQDPSDIPTVTTSNISVPEPEPYAIDIQDTNIYTPNLDGTYSIEDGEPDPEFEPYAIDIQDTNIYTLNEDGTYTIEDGEPDPEPDFDPNEYIGSPGDAPDNVTATNTATQTTDANEYFNLFRSTAPSSWLRNSIYNAYGTGPDFNVDVYQAADGSLRFTETDQLVPEEYLKYIPYARRTEMDAPVEEEA